MRHRLIEYGFLSTLSLRRATPYLDNKPTQQAISIHALLAESDGKSNKLAGSKLVFLSTLSLRRATIRKRQVIPIIQISIHALLAESDQTANSLADTPPEISIHALLAESDLSISKTVRRIWHFYPRSPCGERRFSDITSILPQPFLSTLSLRRATDVPVMSLTEYGLFLSTLSLRRATWRYLTPKALKKSFLSTLSLRRATLEQFKQITETIFLSTLSLRRATFSSCRPDEPSGISIHALLAESDN